MKRFFKCFNLSFLHLRFEVLLLPHVRCEPAPRITPSAYQALFRACLYALPAAITFFAGVTLAQNLAQAEGWLHVFGRALLVALIASLIYFNYVFWKRGRTFLSIWKSGTDAERLALLKQRRLELDQLND